MARLLVAVLVLGGLGTNEARAARYTLKQLIDKVTREYPGVKAAEASVDASRAQYAQARRSWAPTGDLSIQAGTTPSVVCLENDPATKLPYKFPGSTADDQRCNAHWDNWTFALNLGLNITQPIYTFGKIEAATATARAGIDASKGYLAAAKADVVVNAMRAYWSLKWARAARDTLDEGLDKLKEWIAKVEDDLNASRGGYNEGDLARLKIALDEGLLNRGDIIRGLQVAEAGLKIITDDPQADVDDAELDMMEVAARPVSFWLDAAFVHRPESRLLQANVDAQKGYHRWRFADMLPDFGAQISAGFYFAPGINSPTVSKTGSLSAVLALRSPIDWGVRYGRLEQARADELAATYRRRRDLGGIAVEVDQAFANAEEARHRADTLAHSAKVARGWFVSVDQNMAAGLVTDGREAVDAARSYFGYRIRYLQAILDTNMTLVALRRATGVE